MTVAVPTLAADPRWQVCLEALGRQTFPDFEVVIIDNSGAGRVQTDRARVIPNACNAGFGAAINQAWRSSTAPYLASLNDDAEPEPEWLAALVTALEADLGLGMAASRVLLREGQLDSAGMRIARDGSSKQAGHGADPAQYEQPGEALFPSGAAALYRRAMLEETGGFDESYFLYCEDTDLGLRAQWLGWRCVYVPGAKVRHGYSATAGRASSLKAYLVERNRLRTVVKCFPPSWLAAAPLFSVARYFWHGAALVRGKGKAAEFRAGGGKAWQLPWFVLKAHLALLAALPGLLRSRRLLRRRRPAAEMKALLRRHLMPLREVAAQ